MTVIQLSSVLVSVSINHCVLIQSGRISDGNVGASVSQCVQVLRFKSDRNSSDAGSAIDSGSHSVISTGSQSFTVAISNSDVIVEGQALGHSIGQYITGSTLLGMDDDLIINLIADAGIVALNVVASTAFNCLIDCGLHILIVDYDRIIGGVQSAQRANGGVDQIIAGRQGCELDLTTSSISSAIVDNALLFCKSKSCFCKSSSIHVFICLYIFFVYQSEVVRKCLAAGKICSKPF